MKNRKKTIAGILADMEHVLLGSWAFSSGLRCRMPMPAGYSRRWGRIIDTLPLLWVAAPLTGLVVQPIVGYMSDRTWNILGRRRPYFFFGAIFTTLALVVMPNSPALWVAAGTLWILDASINITMEPFRAFVGDNLAPSQRSTGYVMQSFFIALGPVVASALPWMMSNWLGIANTAPAGEIPDSVRYSFYFGAAVLFFAVMWTVVSSREYDPEELASLRGPCRRQRRTGTGFGDRVSSEARHGVDGNWRRSFGFGGDIGRGRAHLPAGGRHHRIRTVAVARHRYAAAPVARKTSTSTFVATWWRCRRR